MKVLVTGGREYNDRKAVNLALSMVHAHYRIHALVQGGARGADRFASQWAYLREGITQFEHKADWKTMGKVAGRLRNAAMLNEHPDVDLVVAFPGDTGTAHMVSIAEERGFQVWRALVDPFPTTLKSREAATI